MTHATIAAATTTTSGIGMFLATLAFIFAIVALLDNTRK